MSQDNNPFNLEQLKIDSEKLLNLKVPKPTPPIDTGGTDIHYPESQKHDWTEYLNPWVFIICGFVISFGLGCLFCATVLSPMVQNFKQ